MIYGRWGNTVTIVRLATIDDVERYDKRKPDADDRRAVKSKSYVIVKDIERGDEQLYHLAFMRADDGSREIMAAINATRTS